MRLRRDAQVVIHRVMHRPRGKQGLDFCVLVHCSMPFPHWRPHVRCARRRCIGARHLGALARHLFHSRVRLTCRDFGQRRLLLGDQGMQGGEPDGDGKAEKAERRGRSRGRMEGQRDDACHEEEGEGDENGKRQQQGVFDGVPTGHALPDGPARADQRQCGHRHAQEEARKEPVSGCRLSAFPGLPHGPVRFVALVAVLMGRVRGGVRWHAAQCTSGRLEVHRRIGAVSGRATRRGSSCIRGLQK